jgi:DNA end-binding protein Ku
VIWYDENAAMAGDRLTHAVDIVAFVEAYALVYHHIETTYRLAPAPGGERLYGLLRDTLERTGRIAIAHVVIHAHQHLAALVPQGRSLILNTLRWTREATFAPPAAPMPEAVNIDADDVELALLTQEALGLAQQEEDTQSGDGFHADIMTPEFLTDDDDDIDDALAYALRPHLQQGQPPPRRQRIVRRQRSTRLRARSRMLS